MLMHWNYCSLARSHRNESYIEFTTVFCIMLPTSTAALLVVNNKKHWPGSGQLTVLWGDHAVHRLKSGAWILPDGLMQMQHNSRALAMELRLVCTNLFIAITAATTKQVWLVLSWLHLWLSEIIFFWELLSIYLWSHIYSIIFKLPVNNKHLSIQEKPEVKRYIFR